MILFRDQFEAQNSLPDKSVSGEQRTIGQSVHTSSARSKANSQLRSRRLLAAGRTHIPSEDVMLGAINNLPFEVGCQRSNTIWVVLESDKTIGAECSR